MRKINNRYNFMSAEFVYLLQEREFIKTNENIYKIGMTKQANLARFKSYPNGTILILHIMCNDCKSAEKAIMGSFAKLFKQRRDIGLEYFEGDYHLKKKENLNYWEMK